jgi:hypothetical protein
MPTAARADSGHGMNGGADAGGAPDAAAMARDVAGKASDLAGEVASRLPAAAASTRDAITTTQLRMEATSDELLTNGTMLSLGVALGLLLGGSNRLLVAMALIPAAAMGATLIDRRSRVG